MDFTLQIINNSNLSLSIYDESNDSVSVTTEVVQLEVLSSNSSTLEISSQPFTTIQGPPGPQGPSGSSAGYVHTQTISSSIWTVNHNLGFKPAISVHSMGGVEVLASVVHTSNNQVIISFENDFTGYAIAR